MSRTPVSASKISNLQLLSNQSKFGGASAYFTRSSSDYINCNQAVIPATGDFTVELWFRLPVINTRIDLISQFASGTNGRFAINVNSNNTVTAFIGGTGWPGASTTTTTVSANTWYHMAYVRSGSSFKFYLNGVNEGATGTSSNAVYTSTNTYIGFTPGQTFMNGWIDEVRISNSARYTANFTPATQPFINDANTLMLLHMDGKTGDYSSNIIDDTGIRNKNGITPSDFAYISTTQSKFSGSSAYFDGTGDYLDITHDGTISFGTNDFTVECWVYPTAISAADAIIGEWSQTTGYKWLLTYGASGTNNSLRFGHNNGNFTLSTTSGINYNTWTHVAVVRSGGTRTFYINGVAAGSETLTNDITTAGKIRVSAVDFSTLYDSQHYIDELRISKSARYTANFTPSTKPFVNDSNTLLLMHMDGNNDSYNMFYDDNGSRATRGVIGYNNIQIETAQKKFGRASALFDGTNDYLAVGYSNTDTFAIGTGDFTFEWWQRSDSNIDPYAHLFSIAGSDGYSFSISIESGQIYFRLNSGIVSPSSLGSHGTILNTWCHFAVVRSSGVVKCYKDGTNISGSGHTNTNSFERTSSEQNFAIGVDKRNGVQASTYFGGYMDEVRVSKTARYTANFTPSATAFLDDANTVLLLHMDDPNGIFLDDSGFYVAGTTQEGAASLSAAVTVSSTGTRIRLAQSTNTITASVTSDVSRTRSADSSLSSEFTTSTLASKIMDAMSAMSAEFTQTTYGSRTTDIDLYAFTDAALVAQAGRIRLYESAELSQFDIATDFVRIRSGDATADSLFDFTSVAERSRYFTSDLDVAFSIDTTVEKILDFTSTLTTEFTLAADITTFVNVESDLTAEFTQTVLEERFRETTSDLAAEFVITVSIVHIEGTDIHAFADCALTGTADVIRGAISQVTGTFIQTTVAKKSVKVASALTSFATVTTSKYIGTGRPWSATSTLFDNGNGARPPVTAINHNFDARPKINQPWFIQFQFENDTFPNARWPNNTTIFSMGALTLATNNSGYPRLTIVDSDNVSHTIAANNFYINSTIRTDTLITILKSGNSSSDTRCAIYANGSLINISGNTAREDGFNFTWKDTGSFKYTFNNTLESRLHNFIFAVGTNYGQSVGNATVYQYTNTNYVNDQYTKVFLKTLNATPSTGIDYTAQSLTGAAALTSAFSLTAKISYDTNGAALVASAGTLTVNGGKLKEVDSAINAEFTTAINIGETYYAEANLANEFTQSTDVTKTTDYTADLVSEFTQTTELGIIKEMAAGFDTISTQLTAAAKIGDYLIDCSVAFTQTTDVFKYTGIESNLEVISSLAIAFDHFIEGNATAHINATIDTTGDRIRFADSALASEFTLTEETSAVINVQANLQSNFDVSASVTSFVGVIVALTSEFTQSTDVTRVITDSALLDSAITVDANVNGIYDSTGNIASEFTTDITYDRLRDAASSFEAVASQLTAVAKIGGYLIDCSVTSSLTTTGNTFSGAQVIIDASTDLSAACEVTRATDVTLLSEFAVTVDGTTNITADADLSNEFAISIGAQRTRDITSYFESVTVEVAAIGVIKEHLADLFVLSNLDASATKIQQVEANLSTAAQLSATPGIVADSDIHISSAMNFVVTIRAIHIETIVHKILPESREYIMRPESREYKILGETRLYKINSR